MAHHALEFYMVCGLTSRHQSSTCELRYRSLRESLSCE